MASKLHQKLIFVPKNEINLYFFTFRRFPANTENLQLSTAPPLTSLLSSSSLAQKRPAQTISPSLINQPKRMAPPSESLGGFDLSALLKSKPVSVEVSMGQGATTKDEEDGSSGPKLKVAQFRCVVYSFIICNKKSSVCR